MAKSWEAQTINLDEARLRLTVEEVLQEALGRSVKISTLKHEPSPFATLFPANILHIRLQSGKRISLFLKHLGSEESDHPEKQCPDREIRIYEELLGNDNLPVVKYYGSRWNETSNRREVFLEYIDDWNLKYHELEHWFTAARRLAHLHAHFASQAEMLLACQYLLQFDAVYYYEWADRALLIVADQSAGLAADLEPVVKSYDRVVDVITRQPLTLVHNDPSPKNVIADRSSSPARICLVDWEMAGMGCGLMDLVHLKYGLDRENDQKMREAYGAELAGTGLLPSSPQDLGSLFAACEIHKTVYRLAHSKIWQLPLETVSQWVTEIQEFLGQV